MIPAIAIIGRPNVGKSTLFNCLTRTFDALVADFPGMTRDRKYGEGEYEGVRYLVIDTGGMETDSTASPLQQLMTKQTLQAIDEASIVLFVVDAKVGLVPQDDYIATVVRHIDKPVFLVVNKSESVSGEIAKSDFYQLGFARIICVASSYRRGINKLMEEVLASIPTLETTNLSAEQQEAIKIAVIGRPNVGKSTLVNRILGEERVLVFDEPGTTRDSIYIPFEKGKNSYCLIDTAGVRRRTKINEVAEKFSVVKTLQTIAAADVVIFVLNAREGVSEQDLRLLDFVVEAGKALVLAVNKWDGLTLEARKSFKQELQRRLEFVAFAKMHFISALHGTAVGDLFPSILVAYGCATKKLSTPILTRILQDAVTTHQPPLVHGRRIKLRYAHAGGSKPPLIIIHGNQTHALSADYLRYLINFFKKRLKLVGTPLKIEFKSGENPFKGRKNILTSRQQAKKQRLFQHVKKRR